MHHLPEAPLHKSVIFLGDRTTVIGADFHIGPNNRLLTLTFTLTLTCGAFGIDFSTPDNDISTGLSRVAKGILRHGVTSFCPTVITSPPEVYHRLLPHFHRRPGSREGAGILGEWAFF